MALWEVYFFLGKADKQGWTEAAWQRTWFHAKQWQECLGDPIETTYINIHMESEVYSSLYDAVVVKPVSLNPNCWLSTWYLTGVGWRSVEVHQHACKNSRDCQWKS